MAEINKVGIISCSGEEIAAGTVSRLAARRVLELLRPQSTVTLCLPLFLAGEEMERRFARLHPTITVDGCHKLCAKRGTEKYSGQVAASLVVSDILGNSADGCRRSLRDSSKTDEQAVWLVAERIAAEVDVLLESGDCSDFRVNENGTVPFIGPEANTPAPGACSCGSPAPEGNLRIKGKTVSISGLPMIFEHLRKLGLKPGSECSEKVLETVRIYHAVEPAEENSYREALGAAYNDYCIKQTETDAHKK
jgi:uncharacterized metal-binding protein